MPVFATGRDQNKCARASLGKPDVGGATRPLEVAPGQLTEQRRARRKVMVYLAEPPSLNRNGVCGCLLTTVTEADDNGTWFGGGSSARPRPAHQRVGPWR